MKKLLLILFTCLSTICSSQIMDHQNIEDNKLNCDLRIIKHYSSEDILAMDSLKFEMIKYYYCDSYILDTSNVENFDINNFDISIYEESRDENEYISLEHDGLIIVLIPKNECVYTISFNSQNKRKS